MNGILKLSTSAVSFIFSQVSTMESKVSWIRTPDYIEQLYVSPSYENVWGVKPEKLYQQPLSWNNTLVNTDLVDALKQRLPDNNPSLLFQIRDAAGRLKFMKDSCFHVFGLNGELIAVAGVSEEISETLWEDSLHNNKSTSSDALSDIFDQAIKRSAASQQASQSESRKAKEILTAEGITVKFTFQESNCLQGLVVGHSAKQIARTLKISPRTVEVHIEHMKSKLGCRSRLELMSKLNIR